MINNVNLIKNEVFCILGPTSIGKSFISIELNKLLPIQIISVDSGLVYKFMNIGTAKPTVDELKVYSHKLVNLIDPKDSYSVNNFFFDAKYEINKSINKKFKIPLLVGGTMMYYNVLFNGLYILPKSNIKTRNDICVLMKIFGCKFMYNILLKLDYLSAKNIHVNDKYRIIRALEVFFITGTKISYLRNNFINKMNFNFNKIIILPKNREFLLRNIKKRFYKMLSSGFEEEVYFLYNRKDLNINMPSIKCIGYKQMWLYIDGKISYNNMINNTINETINLAKKQFTWLNKWKKSYFFILDNYKNCVKKIYNLINLLIK